MRYFKMLVYVEGEDYETRESLIPEDAFRKYQQAIEMGATHLSLADRVIKISSIKEILPAYDIVSEYLGMGVSLKQLGLPELTKLAAPEKEKKLSEGRKKLETMKSKSGFGRSIIEEFLSEESPSHE